MIATAARPWHSGPIMLADALVRWSARLFVACYVGRICIDAATRRDARSQRIARWLWTLGCLICVAHVALSFHLVHDWSLSSAYEHVLKRTQETTGIASGFGLYVNFAFVLLWLADTILWWRNLNWTEQRIPYWIVQGVFAFLTIQATAVFGPSFWIPITAAVALTLIGLSIFARRTSSPSE